MIDAFTKLFRNHFVYYAKDNDVIELYSNELTVASKYAHIKYNKVVFEETEIEVFKGAEFNTLNDNQIKVLLNKEFIVSKLNNRMAYQLEGVLENKLEPILTSAVLPGTVQLTPSGRLIILMRDCQVTGGYPRVLQLTESAINILSQKSTNSSIKFKLLS